jgi:hypothetical protein
MQNKSYCPVEKNTILFEKHYEAGVQKMELIRQRLKHCYKVMYILGS